MVTMVTVIHVIIGVIRFVKRGDQEIKARWITGSDLFQCYGVYITVNRLVEMGLCAYVNIHYYTALKWLLMPGSSNAKDSRHSRHQPACPKKLGSGALLRDTSLLS